MKRLRAELVTSPKSPRSSLAAQAILRRVEAERDDALQVHLLLYAHVLYPIPNVFGTRTRTGLVHVQSIIQYNSMYLTLTIRTKSNIYS